MILTTQINCVDCTFICIMVFNTQLLAEMIEGKYVKVQQHPTQDLFIYNYTALAQYDRVWNDCTIQSRGLILDGDGKIVARPFLKFFNLGEYEDQLIPAESFDVYEKMDGSLGILYWVDDEPYIATRGSFVSEQSVVATRMLHDTYQAAIPLLDKRFTYLFEIIYPENRIVVDYGANRELVLLAVVDRETGAEQPLADIGIPVVKRYDGIKDIHKLKSLETFNKEGFVIRYSSGYRLKVKFDEYQRIHRILTGVSSISIWEYLKEGQPFDEILERVPDEFYQWVKAKSTELTSAYDAILAKAKADFKVLETRKETALYFQTCQYPAVMFNLLDGKSVDQVIWKMLRPVHEKPFSDLDKEEI